eukprot:SAG11_NODE_22528_length_404_cov_1.177049_1_plen_84_part_10
MDGQRNSHLKLEWTGDNGDCIINATHNCPYYVVSEHHWRSDDYEWTASAYQASCYHWLSDSEEGIDDKTTTQIIEEEGQWIEAT